MTDTSPSRERRPRFRNVCVLMVLSGATLLNPGPTGFPVQAETPEKNLDDTPISIRRHSQAFQTSWRNIQSTIRRNEALKSPRPEPYLDRAELLAAAHDHESALKDCLTAVRIVRASSKNLAEQARYLGLLEQSLRRIVDAPERLYVADAEEQFRLGRPLFHRGLDKQALARFDGAVRLNPKKPIYLYFRGLTLKRLGRDVDATRDIRRAVSLDVQHLFAESLNVSTQALREYRAETFERVQGPLRAWMESFFDGVPVSSPPDLRLKFPAK